MRLKITMLALLVFSGCASGPSRSTDDSLVNDEAFCRSNFYYDTQLKDGKYKLIDRASFDRSNLLAILGIQNPSGQFQPLFAGKGATPHNWSSSLLLFQSAPDQLLTCAPLIPQGEGHVCSPEFRWIGRHGNEWRVERSLCVTNDIVGQATVPVVGFPKEPKVSVPTRTQVSLSHGANVACLHLVAAGRVECKEGNTGTRYLNARTTTIR
jgi:hypothetical protein